MGRAKAVVGKKEEQGEEDEVDRCCDGCPGEVSVHEDNQAKFMPCHTPVGPAAPAVAPPCLRAQARNTQGTLMDRRVVSRDLEACCSHKQLGSGGE